MLSIFFAACSIEKRHYRGGYYVQRAADIFNRDRVQNKTMVHEEYGASIHDCPNSESNDVASTYTESAVHENIRLNSSTDDYSATDANEYTPAASEKKMHSTERKLNASKEIVSDEPDEKKKSGTKMIFWGLVLLPLWPMTIFAIVLLILGTVRRHKIAKKNPKSVETVNTKTLWVLSIIFLGISIASIILVPFYEIFVLGLIALPLALIYVIEAPIMDRRNKKLNPEENNKDKNKKSLRILKSILLWLIVLLTLGIFGIIVALISSI